MARFSVMACVLVLAMLGGCDDKRDSAVSNQKITITLDWLPSPEYYGFYYALDKGLYESVGISVTIKNGSGAPVVAAQLAANNISVGTTTSDNILRQAARGVKFRQLIPIMKYNPVSLVSTTEIPIRKFDEILGKTIGTNPQASPYAQFSHLLAKNKISRQSYKEYPIGFGGAVQLKSREVDGFLAYTTNQAVDVALAGLPLVELHFGEDLGLRTYGLVLAVGNKVENDNQWDTLVRNLIDATIQGYKKGAKDVAGSVAALKKIEPNLDERKLAAAIKKMSVLNAAAPSSVPEDLDNWVSIDGVDVSKIRAELQELYTSGNAIWERLD